MINLIVTLCCLVVVLYVLALYIEWRTTKREIPEVTLETVQALTERVERNIRKGIYSVRRLWRGSREYGSEKIKELFVKIFPGAEHALKERDMLTGLSSGPSSYFLLELSQYRSKERNRRNRKNVQE